MTELARLRWKITCLCKRLEELELVGSGEGILSLNGELGNVQTFDEGTAGTDFNIVSALNVHTFNIPTASALNRGLLSSADWIAFNAVASANTIYTGNGSIPVATNRIVSVPLNSSVRFVNPLNSGSGYLYPLQIIGTSNAGFGDALGLYIGMNSSYVQLTQADDGLGNPNSGYTNFISSGVMNIDSGFGTIFNALAGDIAFVAAAGNVSFQTTTGDIQLTTTTGDILIESVGSSLPLNNSPVSIPVLDQAGYGILGYTTLTSLTASSNAPIVQTVAQMQALALAGTLIPGQLYQISNADTSRSVLNIRAYSITELEKRGEGTYANVVMTLPVTCTIWYDLTTDLILRIIEPLSSNDITDLLGGISIQYFPFDNIAFISNTLLNTDLSGGFTPVAFNNNHFEGSVLTLLGTTDFSDNRGHSCIVTDNGGIIVNNSFEAFSDVNLGTPGTLESCHIGNDATLFLPDNVNFEMCIIGNGKTINTTAFATAYTQTDKVYQGEFSTFSVSEAQVTGVNPTVGGDISMASFPFAGILLVSDGTNDLVRFLNVPSDHTFRIVPDIATVLDVLDTAAAGGNNIQLEVSGTTIIVDGSVDDYLEFKAGVNTANIIKIGGVIRS